MLIPSIALLALTILDTPAAADAPKVEAPSAEAPKADTPKADAPKVDAPKLDAPKADAKPSAPALQAGYKDGFFIASDDGNYKLRLRGLLQTRLEMQGHDPDMTTWTNHLTVQRAQVEVGGNAFSKDLTFAIKIELGSGFTFLKDGYANWVFIPEVLELRAGQWKRPFSRQELTGDVKVAFVDRSETNKFFKGGRDAGIALHNDLEKNRMIEYSVGLFAGGSEKPTFTGDVVANPKDDTKQIIDNVKESTAINAAPTLVGRIGFNQGDVKGLSEIDLDGGDLRFGVAASALETFEVSGGSRGATRAELDGIVKAYGFDLSAAVFTSMTEKKDQPSTLAQDYEATGLHLQAGYVISNLVHPGIRYDLISQSSDITTQELTAGLGFLIFGQNCEVIVDGSALLSNDPTKPATDIRGRAQLALAF